MAILEIENLHVSVSDTEILKGVDLKADMKKVNAIMGPNGSGKSTLAYAIMGHPDYEITKGTIKFDGQDVTEMEPDERARAGLFLSFQYPSEVPGVSVSNFLRTVLNSLRDEQISLLDFKKLLDKKLELLKMDPSFADRYLNEGFSGGEKKRAEILQLAVIEPKFAVLDETDSGLDIDALRVVAEGVNHLLGGDLGVLLITHYQRLLNHIKPDAVHIMIGGRVVRSGSAQLALKVEEKGYDWLAPEGLNVVE